MEMTQFVVRYINLIQMNFQEQRSQDNQFCIACNKLICITKSGNALKKWKKLASRSKDRWYRLNELVKTEGDYYRDLNLIINSIKKPLLQANLIDLDEAKKMFISIDSMILLSQKMKAELSVQLEKWDRNTTKIGQIMIRYSKYLKLYKDFFINFNETQRKLKQLLRISQKARQIQVQLTPEQYLRLSNPRIILFEDLISKPFQRPLKYHLLLKDYTSKTQESHPDYLHLKEAINCYMKVNEQNNKSLQDKQKDGRLLKLDDLFKNIIDKQARYFVAEYTAIYIDLQVTLYILSDIVIISQKSKNNEKQCLRISFNKFSYVEKLPDQNYFINRLYFYGSRKCVHLAFLQTKTRDQVHAQLKGLIQEMGKNQDHRESVIQKETFRTSVITRKPSFTQLQPQFKRPMIVTVLGNERRMFGPDRIVEYFIIQFHPTSSKVGSATTPHLTTMVTLQILQKIQKLVKLNYPQVNFFKISYSPKGITQMQARHDQDKRLQFSIIFLQLQLNTIIRDPNILKRIDIILHLLHVTDSLWLHLKQQNSCSCSGCQNKLAYKHATDYFNQQRDRVICKNQFNSTKYKYHGKQFCDMRTLRMQELLASLPPTQLLHFSGEQKLIWLKSKLGWINHTFTNSKPISSLIKPIQIKVYYWNINQTDLIKMDCYPSERVKQVIDFIGKRLNMNMEDYCIVAQINKTLYLLSDDQIIGDLLIPPKPEQGLFSSFTNIFKNEDYKITLYLRKLWVLDFQQQKQYKIQKIYLQVEDLLKRLKRQEVKLTDDASIQIITLYYMLTNFQKIQNITASSIQQYSNQIYNIVAQKYRKRDFIQKMFSKILSIRNDSSLNKDKLAIKIIEKIQNEAGWGCYFFQALMRKNKYTNTGGFVDIGCSLKGLTIRKKNEYINFLQFKFQSANWSCFINGYNLIIRQDSQEYSFSGVNLWKLKQHIELYKLYNQSFIAKN